MNPEVSVILPAYNAARYVEHALTSILSQSFTAFEAIVVDDGSTDETAALVQQFGDRRVRLLRNGHNLGLVASLQRAIAEAQGTYLARMDADDWSAPDRLAIQVDWLNRNPRLGAVSCHYQNFSDSQGVLDTVALPVQDADIRHDLYCKTHCFCHPAVMMRRQALEEAGGYRADWFPAEDRELWMRLLETWHGANVPQVLHHMRRHAGSVTSQNMRRQSKLVIEATVAALVRRRAPPDVAEEVTRTGWARGNLFAAFGLAIEGDMHAVADHLIQAISLDESAARGGFDEILRERIAAYMHNYDADAAGAKRLLRRVFSVLPPVLADLRVLQPALEAQVHTIAAFYYAQSGQPRQAQREALSGLRLHRSMWRNRGLIKLALRLS